MSYLDIEYLLQTLTYCTWCLVYFWRIKLIELLCLKLYNALCTDIFLPYSDDIAGWIWINCSLFDGFCKVPRSKGSSFAGDMSSLDSASKWTNLQGRRGMSTAFDGTKRISHLSTMGVLVAKLACWVEIRPAWKMIFFCDFPFTR